MNLLLIANELRYNCGVTNHLLHLSRGLSALPGISLFMIAGGGRGIERFNDINVNMTIDDRFLHSNRSAINYLSAVRWLPGYLKRNKINIVHSHTHYAANIAAHASYFRKFITVQTNHGLLQVGGKLKHFNADSYVAINEHIYEFILRESIAKPENVHFIRCGINVPDEPAVKSSSALRVIAASRFIKEKGLDLFIDAVSLAKPKLVKDALFFIAGSGEEERSLKARNAEKGSLIEFTGSVRELGNVLKDTHIFVYPSRSKREGFPAVITEAGANNNLLISSSFNGIEPVISNGENGLLFEPDNAEQLADLLVQTVNNFSEFSDMSLKFYTKVKELFSADLMIRKHTELYEKCLIQ